MFPATMRTFTKDTVLSEHSRGAAWHVLISGTACYVWIGLRRTLPFFAGLSFGGGGLGGGGVLGVISANFLILCIYFPCRWVPREKATSSSKFHFRYFQLHSHVKMHYHENGVALSWVTADGKLLYCPSGACTLGLIKRNPKSSQRLTKTKNLHGSSSKSILNQNVAFQRLYKKGLWIYSK